MADYKPGSMEIRTHEKTFAGFVRFAAWAVVALLCILIFMALANA